MDGHQPPAKPQRLLLNSVNDYLVALSFDGTIKFAGCFQFESHNFVGTNLVLKSLEVHANQLGYLPQDPLASDYVRRFASRTDSSVSGDRLRPREDPAQVSTSFKSMIGRMYFDPRSIYLLHLKCSNLMKVLHLTH